MLSGDKAGEEVAFESYSSLPKWMQEKSTLGWTELSKHRLVVVLGEQGSGKTWELRHQAELSSKNGRKGFFFSLDRLVETAELPFRDEDEKESFDDWYGGNAQAAFFLDSVDESKIRKTDDFYLALDRFRNAIGSSRLNRAWITISSRITEWLPEADYRAVRDRLHLPNPREKKEEKSPQVVHILPLNEESVLKYASSQWGNDDGISFTEAIASACAFDFVRRPADVNDLFCYWKRHGRLGSLKETLSFVIDQQLDKSSSRNHSDPLSLERARAGAEYMAAATIFCRRFQFGIPDDDLTNPNVLVARRCLPDDWQKQELHALLQRSVFDGASHGCIRFHHRRISEFLAAQWLSRLMEAGCPIFALKELLIHSVRGKLILRPSAAPVAAWLCAGSEPWNREIFKWIIESSPESLLKWGDPAQLNIEQRLHLLDALKSRVITRERYWWDVDRSALKRLASIDIEEEINHLLRDPDSHVDLRNFLVDVAEAGCLRGCTDSVRDTAICALSGGGDFVGAIRALEQFGDLAALRSVADAISVHESLTPREFASFALAAYPGVWNAEEFVRAYHKVLPNAEWSGWEYSLQERVKEVSTTSCDGRTLLAGLSGDFLSNEDPDEEIGDDENLSRHQLALTLSVCEGMLARINLDESEQIAIGTALGRVSRRVALGYYTISEIKWDELIGERHSVRRAYFERAATALSNKIDRFPSFITISIYYELLRVCAKDLPWILEKLKLADSPAEREQACRWALEAWEKLGHSRLLKKQIMKAAANDEQLVALSQGLFRLGFRIQTIAFWNRYFRKYFYSHKWYSRWHQIVRHRNQWMSAYRLWWYRDQLRSGKNIEWLMKIAFETARPENSLYLTATDWTITKKRWGKRVANDTRLGCKRMWRKYTPSLPSENPSNNSISNGVITGLAGIMAEWEDGEIDFAMISLNEAEQIARYAFNEINGFPQWFPDFLKSQLWQIRNIVLSECEKELSVPANIEVNGLLQRMSWNEELKWPQIQNDLLDLLEIKNPQNIDNLDHVLKILCRNTDKIEKKLADLCQRRSSLSSSEQAFPYWMATWLLIDASRAVDMLNSQLEMATKPRIVMEKICTILRGNKLKVETISSETSWLDPKVARKFIPLVYKWVRLEDDIQHHSSYSTGQRDYAQEFRGAIVESFARSTNLEVASVLEELQVNPDFFGINSYLGNLIERSYGVVSEGLPWKEGDVVLFKREYEIKPKTQYDLYRMALHRLDNLKREVENGDNSPRSELREEDNESGARRWFARKLREKSNNLYEIPQESEISGRARIDLQISTPGISSVPIELKVLDKGWTISQLLESLEHQLAGAYLRDSNTHYGIFLLIHFKPRTWRDSEENILSIDNVLKILRQKRDALISVNNNIRGLEIVVMDFMEPPSWRDRKRDLF